MSHGFQITSWDFSKMPQFKESPGSSIYSQFNWKKGKEGRQRKEKNDGMGEYFTLFSVFLNVENKCVTIL